MLKLFIVLVKLILTNDFIFCFYINLKLLVFHKLKACTRLIKFLWKYFMKKYKKLTVTEGLKLYLL